MNVGDILNFEERGRDLHLVKTRVLALDIIGAKLYKDVGRCIRLFVG